MPTIKVGRVRPVFKGDYSSATAYVVLDRVKYNGQIWECVADAAAGTAPQENSSAFWVLIGAKGDKGETGAQGPKGDTGETGLQGPQGPKGDTGETGPQGPQGEPGATGLQGPQGPEGPKGDAGPQGPKGDTGETGPVGPQGEQGEPGPQGAQGPAGSQGPQGDQGPAGPAGTTFTPSVDASGNLSWSNTDGKQNPATVNIKGPKGDKGDKGDTGATGPEGPQGEVGPQGPQGPQGEQGIQGVQGPKGDTGPQGPQGPAGADAPIDTYILKANSRGTLAGYETPLVQATALSVTNATNDSSCVTGAVAITVNDGASGQSWTKTVALTNASATVTLGTNWKWVGGSAPTISANCVLVLHWCNSFGIANLVASS